MPTQAETIQALRNANHPVDPTYTPAQPYDPMQAVRMFGSALGIDDAIKALRGEMTPDEQQKFAVTAAMGLGAGEVLGPVARGAAKTMGELLPEMFAKTPNLAKLTPAKYFQLHADMGMVPDAKVVQALNAPPKSGVVPGPNPVLPPLGLHEAKMILPKGLKLESSSEPGDYFVSHADGSPYASLTKNDNGTYHVELEHTGHWTTADNLHQAANLVKHSVSPNGTGGWNMPRDMTEPVKNAPVGYIGKDAIYKTGYDYLSPFMKQQVKPQPHDLSDASIKDVLSKNPGASIFDVAGESSPYNPKEGTEPSQLFKTLGRFPQDMPYAAPPKALEHNFVQPAIHGTRQPEVNWTVPGKPIEMPVGETGGLAAAHGQGVDALRLPQYELGVHFGTPDQAHEFAGLTLGSGYLPRTYPTVLQTGNSLELPDLGSWGPSKVISALRQLNRKGTAIGAAGGKESPLAQNTNLIGSFPDNELDKLGGKGDIRDIRQYLANKGYDSINYINTVEGETPQRSYIMFKPSQEEPDYVGGVRSPFAAFDPTKLGSPALAAGVAGAGAAGVMSPQISEYIKALQGDQQQ